MLELEKLLPKKTSVRQLRIAELIKKTVAEALIENLVDSKIIVENFITISKVNLSPDLHNCTIYITAFNCNNIKELMAELNNFAPKFRFIISKQIKLKSSPQVIFRYDDTLEHVAKIEELIESTKE
ncbi:MAG: 30S ribosome-binding factor RbfA [Pseudomonadota bacterium]